MLPVLSIVSGCGPEGSPYRPDPQDGFPAADAPAGGGADAGSTSVTDAAGASSETALGGLPCDVSALFETYCLSCHGASLAGGATVHLNNSEALRAEQDGVTLAELSLTRMRATTMPMPPVGARVPSAAIAALEQWVQAGMPDGSCQTSQANDPFAAPPTCSSGMVWSGGDKESPLMHPGRACIDCHTRGVRGERGPSFALAGTVFASGHEPNDCNGVNGRAEGATIEITDANGKLTQINVNTAGNFYLEARPIAGPYTASVRYQGRVRSMLTPQTSGDCNSCHTQDGANGAPGRIALP